MTDEEFEKILSDTLSDFPAEMQAKLEGETTQKLYFMLEHGEQTKKMHDVQLKMIRIQQSAEGELARRIEEILFIRTTQEGTEAGNVFEFKPNTDGDSDGAI